MNKLTSKKITEILNRNNLLTSEKNVFEKVFTDISFNSQSAKLNDLFVIKGNLSENFLSDVLRKNINGFITQKEMENAENISQWIVSDSKKALAVLSAYLFDNPEKKLKILGITGTKGKTTTSFLIFDIINDFFKNQVALFSTPKTIIGSEDKFKFESKLTTPESYDLYKYFNIAVSNGIKFVVMEVSSQSYLMERVFNLKFDVSIFLNISTDHIGASEHKDFNDYFNQKSRILLNSKHKIINKDFEFFNLVEEKIKKENISDVTFFSQNKKSDFNWNILKSNLLNSKFELSNKDNSEIFNTKLTGEYNVENSVAAIIASLILKIPIKNIKNVISNFIIPERSQLFVTKNNGLILVDYAHNYSSLEEIINKKEFEGYKKNLLVGSTGNKAQSRRKDFSEIINKFIDKAILTTDDSQFEDPIEISKEILSYVNNKEKVIDIIKDRKEAIRKIFEFSDNRTLTIIAGKGNDKFQKNNGKNEFYEGDDSVVKKLIGDI